MKTVAGPGLAVVWRTKLRSTLEGVDHAQQIAYCLGRRVIGIGWAIPHLVDGALVDDVLTAAVGYSAPGWGKGSQNIRRFARDTAVGDYVWTRDTSGRYLLGRITGDYRYECADRAREVDIHHVRSVEWGPRPLNDLEVPGAVTLAFTGVGESWSRINNRGARELTPYLWAKLWGEPLPDLEMTAYEVLTSHLDPYDVEDLVYVWLQAARGYLAMPRARRPDTPAYEFTMIHRESGRRAIAQVKTGSSPVDLGALAGAVVDNATDTFAYATSGRYVGDPERVTEIITDDDLLQFAHDHPELLPGRVQTWFELAGGV